MSVCGSMKKQRPLPNALVQAKRHREMRTAHRMEAKKKKAGNKVKQKMNKSGCTQEYINRSGIFIGSLI